MNKDEVIKERQKMETIVYWEEERARTAGQISNNNIELIFDNG